MLEVCIKTSAPVALDVAFTVAPGQITALVGASGAGKSTVLRIIAGLHQPNTGRITVNGAVWLDTQTRVNLPTRRRRIGKVFQHYALFPHMDAAGNVIAALGHLTKLDRMAEAVRLLDLVGLGDMANRRPAELSGGQKQRVAVARALARRPDVLLLDEPFSAVDRATRAGLYREIAHLRDALNMPVLLVTHDLGEAQMLADNVVVLDTGRMLANGPVAEILADPDALRTLGRRNAGGVLSARIVAQEADGLTRLEHRAGTLYVPDVEGAPGTKIRIRVLAHEVILARHAPEGLSALNILPANVQALRQGDGPACIVELRTGDDTIVVRITNRSRKAMALAPGDQIFAILKSMSVARDNIR